MGKRIFIYFVAALFFASAKGNTADITGIDGGYLSDGSTQVAGVGTNSQLLNGGEYRIW